MPVKCGHFKKASEKQYFFLVVIPERKLKEKDLNKVHFLLKYLRVGVLPVILPFSLHDHSLCKNIKFV